MINWLRNLFVDRTFGAARSPHWMIIIFILGSITYWTTKGNTIDGHTKDIETLKASDVIISAQTNQVLVELSAIRADLSWIREKIKDK